jgi:hypothetical protein
MQDLHHLVLVERVALMLKVQPEDLERGALGLLIQIPVPLGMLALF